MSGEGNTDTQSGMDEEPALAVANGTSNSLLDVFGPVALAPAMVAFFWGSTSNERILAAAGLHAGLTVCFAFAVWSVAKWMPRHYERAEALWSVASSLVAASMPWLLAPETRWGYYALGMLFASYTVSDTIYIALRPSNGWKKLLIVTTVSYAVFLVSVAAWAIAIACVVLGLVLAGGHDAIQALMRTLRAERERSEFLAQTDPLTGLANRRGLGTFIERARSSPDCDEIIVASIDIDDFKQINDRHGHHGGDRALVGLADHLSSSLGSHWLPVRSGGDEFVCVSRTGTPDEARAALRRIPSQLHEDAMIPIKISVGIAIGRPDETLLADSFAALRLSKRHGKHRFTEVDDTLRQQIQEARRLGAQLAEAVERSEIKVWAQPIVHLTPGSTTRVHSYECLARWSTEDGINIPPSTFIPMIEDQRLTRELGESIIRKAAEFAAALNDDLPVSVNVSASHFTDPSFAEFVLHTLERHNLEPRRLTIEITETEDVHSSADGWRVARQLRTIGVGLAVDDFGTGYGSLERVMQFPCTQLKLDRSIVAGSQTGGMHHVLAGLARMSAETGLEVVAEGVEDPELAELLASIGLQLAQGYLFGRPQPVEHIISKANQLEPITYATPARIEPGPGVPEVDEIQSSSSTNALS